MRIHKKSTGWFPIPNDPDKGEIEIAHLTPGEIDDLQEEINAFEMVYRPDETGALAPEMRANKIKGDKRYLILCRALKSWKNFFDAEGKPMVCNDENKIAVARADTEFGRFVNECRIKLAEDVKERKEKAGKNSSSTSKG